MVGLPAPAAQIDIMDDAARLNENAGIYAGAGPLRGTRASAAGSTGPRAAGKRKKTMLYRWQVRPLQDVVERGFPYSGHQDCFR